MADKRLNDLSTATDGAYIYAEDASGNQIKISKADLATVVAGLLGNPMGTGEIYSDVNFDTIINNGLHVAYCGENINSPVTDSVRIILIVINAPQYIRAQFALRFDTNEVYYRTLHPSKGWNSWLLINCTN